MIYLILAIYLKKKFKISILKYKMFITHSEVSSWILLVLYVQTIEEEIQKKLYLEDIHCIKMLFVVREISCKVDLFEIISKLATAFART